jgi:hypothetical protein
LEISESCSREFQIFKKKLLFLTKTKILLEDLDQSKSSIGAKSANSALIQTICQLCGWLHENLSATGATGTALLQQLTKVKNSLEGATSISQAVVDEVFRAAELVDESSATDRKRDAETKKSLKLIGDKIRLCATSAMAIETTEKLGRTGQKMDSIRKLQDSKTLPARIHQEKIALQDMLKTNLANANASESNVSDAVQPIATPAGKNLSDQKKRLAEIQRELLTLKQSKTPMSTRWRKIGELQKKMTPTLDGLQDLADESDDLKSDLKTLKTSLSDLVNVIKEVKDRIMHEFFDVCELPRDFAKVKPDEIVFDYDAVDKHEASPEKLQNLENYLEVTDNEDQGEVPELTYEDRIDFLSECDEYPEPLFEDPQGEVNWVNLNMLNHDKNNTACWDGPDGKPVQIMNIKFGPDGKMIIYDHKDMNKKVDAPMSMTWGRSSDLICEADSVKFRDDPLIVNLAGNLTHEFGIQAVDENSGNAISSGCWLNLDAISLKKRDTTEVKFGDKKYVLKGFNKTGEEAYEVVCTDNRKYSFAHMGTWVNLADFEITATAARLKAGKSLHTFCDLIKTMTRLWLVNRDGAYADEKASGKLFSFASCKFDKNMQGLFNDKGTSKKFDGLMRSADGLKTVVDEDATLRFVDFIDPFFRLSALVPQDNGFMLNTDVPLRRFFGKSDDNGNLHIQDDRGFVKDEHKVNIWVPYTNEETGNKKLKLFKSYFGGHSRGSDAYDSLNDLYSATAARDQFLTSPMIANIKDLLEPTSGEAKIPIEWTKWETSGKMLKIRGVKQSASGIKVLDQANNIVAQENKFDYVNLADLIMVSENEAAFKAGAKGLRKCDNLSLPEDICLTATEKKSTVDNNNGFFLNWASTKIDSTGNACFNVGKSLIRLTGLKSDEKGAFLVDEAGKTVARAGEGTFFNLKDLAFESGSDICKVRKSTPGTKIEKAENCVGKTFFKTPQTKNENVFFQLGSLSSGKGGNHYMNHFEKSYLAEGVTKGKDGKLNWLDANGTGVGVEGGLEWVSLKDLVIDDEKMIITLKASPKFYSLEQEFSAKAKTVEWN